MIARDGFVLIPEMEYDHRMDSFVPATLVAALWLFAAARLGRRFVGLQWVDRVEACFLGLGVIGLLSLLCYSIMGVNRTAALILVTASAVAGRTASGIVPSASVWTPFSRVLVVFLVIMAILGFCLVSTPSVFIDNLHYHTGLPWQYAVEGHLVRQDFDIVGGYPHINEMLLLDVMVFVMEPRIARIFNMLLILAFCGALIRRQRDQGDRAVENGLLIWVLTVATPLVMQDAALGKNDILAMIFVYYAGTRLERFMSEGGTKHILLSGVYAGLSLGTKYTSLFFIPGFVACLIFFRRRAAVPYRCMSSLAAFGGALCLVFSPWIIRNIAVYGMPLYPFSLSPERFLSIATQAGTVPILEPSVRWSNALLFPSILVKGFGVKPVTNVLGYHYLVGIICVAGVALSRFRKLLLFDALIYLPAIAIWSASNPQARYLLPVWLAINVRIANATAIFEGFRRTMLLSIFCLLIAGNLAYEVYQEQILLHRFDVILGRVSSNKYLYSFTPVPIIVRNIPESHRSDTILLIGETQRVYFLNPIIVTGFEDFHPLGAILRDTAAPAGIAERLRKMGVRYIYIDYEWWRILRPTVHYLDLSPPREAAFHAFLAERCVIVSSDLQNRAALYRLKESAP